MSKDRTPNQFTQWSSADKESLLMMYKSGSNLSEMAQTLGRSGSSVVSQLAVLGVLYFSSLKGAWFAIHPAWTMKEVQAVDKAQSAPLLNPDAS